MTKGSFWRHVLTYNPIQNYGDYEITQLGFIYAQVRHKKEDIVLRYNGGKGDILIDGQSILPNESWEEKLKWYKYNVLYAEEFN
jgi:hypothetical protein